MKKNMPKFLAIVMFLLMGTFTMAQTQYEVTFTVDMTDADPFNPDTDDLYITGTFANWAQPGTDVAYKMEPLNVGSMFYTLTVSIDSSEIQYKYFRIIDNTPSWDYGEWPGDPNRIVTIDTTVVIDDIWGDITTGDFTEPNLFKYSMYPNPVVTVLNISNTTDISQIDIFDVTGKLIRTTQVQSVQNITIDVAELETGVYIINVHNNKGTQTSKFIKN